MDTELISKIEAVMRECGQIMLNADRSPEMIEEKEGHANFVTTYDKMIQDILKERFATILPEAAFVGEEEDIHESIDDGYAFIVDPIDGTTNFIIDYHQSCISVGLTYKGEHYIGLVYNPYMDEMYVAQKNEGAYLNGKRIHVSNRPLSQGIVIIGTAPYDMELAKKGFDLAYKYFTKSLDIRRGGSAAIDMCHVAAGRAELFFELKLRPWDHAAGTLIVREAGGIVTTVNGEEYSLKEPCSIMARNSVVELD